MPDAGEIAPFILNLQDSNAANRARAAAAIFKRGCVLAHGIVQSWLADAELASCLVLERAGFPKTTVGVAVAPETFERVRAASGSPRLADVPPDQDAKEFELDFPDGVRLDVLTTRLPEDAGAIARYLRKFGEGIQQVELQVNDVGRATEILRSRFAIEPIYPATRAGANGTRVNFFLVTAGAAGKLLIELVQAAAPGL